MSTRARTPQRASDQTRTEAQDPVPPVQARISGISYSLGSDQTLTTTATYRYGGGTQHQQELRLPPHRYALFCALLSSQLGRAVGPADVAGALHDVYYVLYAPQPAPAVQMPEVGHVPDRA